MWGDLILRSLVLLILLGSTRGGEENSKNGSEPQALELRAFQPLEDKLLNRLIDADDGPLEKQLKELVAEYLVATAVEEVHHNASISSISLMDGEIDDGRALLQQQQQQQQQPQIIYVYGTPPPMQNQNQRTQRTRRTKPPRTQRTPRTRRPGHHHNSEERNTQPVIQPIYVQQPPVYQPPPQYQPQQQPPQYQPAPPPQKPLDVPADNIGAGSQTQHQQPPNSGPVSPVYQNASLVQPVGQIPPNMTMYVPQQPSGVQQPYPPPQQQQPPPPPVQIIYIQATTPAGPTGPTTTPRPRPSQEHVYNQVNKILDNVAVGNITGIVDQALGIRAPAPTRNFVNGILNTVFCNPINRLLGRCRG